VCRCSKCGSTQLTARDTEECARIHAVELIARLRREVLEGKQCKRCGETTTAEPPSLPCPRARFTCGFLAWLATMKFVLLVPLNRIHRLLESPGVHIAKSTLVRLIDLAATLAQTIDGVHWTELKAAECLATDGTGLKVLIEGAPEAWHAVLDVLTRYETTVYQFALTKHGDEIASMLKGFKGMVMCDAESRLNELCRQEGIRRANCNAHPRRKFRDAEKYQPVLAKEAGRFLTRIYKVERRADKEGLVGDAPLARRRAETRPIVDAFKLWLEAHLDLLQSARTGPPLLSPPLRRPHPIRRRPEYPHRRQPERTRLPGPRALAVQLALRRERRGRTTVGGPPWRGHHSETARPRRPSLRDLDVRATRYAEEGVRAQGRAAHPRGLQEGAREAPRERCGLTWEPCA
jgi:hypothetical protein